MALATRCPHCQTTFRVAADQLKLRGGIVRCGTCQQVFDGNAALVGPEAPTPVAVPDPAPVPVLVPVAAPAPEQLAEPDLHFDDVPKAAPAPAPAPGEVDAKLLADPDFDVEPVPEPEDDYLPAPDDDFEQQIAALDAGEEESAPAYVLDFDLSEPEPGADVSPQRELDPEPAAEPAPEFDPEPDPEPEPGDHDILHSDPLPAADAGPAPDDNADDKAGELSVSDEPGAAFSSELLGRPSVLDIEHGPLPLLRASAGVQPREPEPEAVKPAPVLPPPPPAPEPDDEPEFVRLARAHELATRRRRLIMATGSVVLALVLLVQGLTTFRNVLVARFPGLKPVVGAGCAVLRCKIELPAQIEALSIEKGELQSLAPATFEYATVLRNESGLTQAWPHIELELNDAFDKALVRRVFTPVQYLPPGVAPARGFAAGSEQAVKIHFELKQLTASGYRIAVFYP